MKKALFFCLLPLVFYLTSSAQITQDPYRKDLIFGLHIGGARTQINHLETTILSEPFFLNYTLDPKERYGLTASGFINYRIELANLGVQLELGYSRQASDLLFNNTQTDFNYHIQFNYHYFTIAPIIKCYPFDYDGRMPGFNFYGGIQFGLNLSPNNIIYTSGGSGRVTAFGTDLEQQQQLRNVLKGRNNFEVLGGVGFEFPDFPLFIDARYRHGLADVVETMPNSYNFIENKNNSQTYQFTVGVYF